MPSIFPDGSAGGVIVRDPETGQPIDQPNVENVSVPLAFDPTCDYTAIPDDCSVRITGRQINAIVSELVNFYVTMDPDGLWDCARLDNLSTAFSDFVANLAGGGGGGNICGAPDGDGSEGDAAVLYCSGSTARKLSIYADGGLLSLVSEYLCGGVVSEPTASNDYLLYCHDGEVRKVAANTFNLYTGEWFQARAYQVNNLTRRLGRLWSPNAAIPTGTAFVEGVSGATWYEVSPTGASVPYEPTDAYLKDTIINRDGSYYAANEDIPAGTAFSIGSEGATWRLVDFSQAFINEWNVDKVYAQMTVVTELGLIYRSTYGSVGANQASPRNNVAQWELIGGERNLYRGPWLLSNSYVPGHMVQRDAKLYSPNNIVPENTAFAIGTTGATWYEVSPSIIPDYASANAYSKDAVIFNDGLVYAANADIPAGTAFTVGVTGATWRLVSFGVPNLLIPLFSTGSAYVERQLVEYEGAIWRIKSGGKTAGAWDPLRADILGERNVVRGTLNNIITPVLIKSGDIWIANVSDATANGFGYPAGSLVKFASDVQVGANWVTTALPSVVGVSSLFSGIFPNNSKRNTPGNSAVRAPYMMTEWGVFKDGGQAPGTTLPVGLGIDEWADQQRMRIFSVAGNQALIGNWCNAYVEFTGATAKTFTLTADGNDNFPIGGSIVGHNSGGQLTFAVAGPVTIVSEGGLLKLASVDGVQYALTKLSANRWSLGGNLVA